MALDGTDHDQDLDTTFIPYLLAHGADPDVPNRSGITPLQFTATESTPISRFKNLLAYISNFAGALQMCVIRGLVERLELLIEAGADVNSVAVLQGYDFDL